MPDFSLPGNVEGKEPFAGAAGARRVSGEEAGGSLGEAQDKCAGHWMGCESHVVLATGPSWSVLRSASPTRSWPCLAPSTVSDNYRCFTIAFGGGSLFVSGYHSGWGAALSRHLSRADPPTVAPYRVAAPVRRAQPLTRQPGMGQDSRPGDRGYGEDW